MRDLWKKQVPAFLLSGALLAGLMPAAVASGSHTIDMEVDAGKSVVMDRKDFREEFEDQVYDGDFYYMVITDYDDLDAYGVFTADNKDGRNHTIDEDRLDDGLKFYYDERNIEGADGYDISTLTFQAKEKRNGTLSLDILLVGEDRHGSKTQLEGKLEIEVDRKASLDPDTIEYTIRPDREKVFDGDDFEEYYDDYCSGSFQYLKFTDASDLRNADGTLYAHHGQKKEVAFTASNLDDYKFYYDDDDDGDYDLDDLSFVADEDFDGVIELEFIVYGTKDHSKRGTLVLRSTEENEDNAISVDVVPGKSVELERKAFRNLFDDRFNGDLDYVTFKKFEDLDDYGWFTAETKLEKTETYTEKNLDGVWFHDDKIQYDTDCDLDTLTFHANRGVKGTIRLEVQLVGEDNDQKLDGILELRIGGEDAPAVAKGDITYQAVAGQETDFDEDDFEDFYEKEYSDDLKYVVFTDSEGLTGSNGRLYSRYDSRREKEFTRSSLSDYRFYYDEEDCEEDRDYVLEDLSFVADEDFTGPVVLEFRAYGSRSSRYVDGTLVLSTKGAVTVDGSGETIRYYTTAKTPVQINPYDIVRHLQAVKPGSRLLFVSLDGVPKTGELYYNYYGTSATGPKKEILTASNLTGKLFVLSPAKSSEYGLGELTYVPAAGNSCAVIPFTAYNERLEAVSGTILISATNKTAGEVYGPVFKNSPVPFPAGPLQKVVKSATGVELAGIRLVELPDPKAGKVMVSSGGVSLPADLKTVYDYGGSSMGMSQLRFVPAEGYTGSVEIPYAAVDQNGKAFAMGKLCLGVLEHRETLEKFKKDITNHTWCYKYVLELADAGVIGGYKDGSFKEKNSVTWGAALKMVLLAAGYPEQKDFEGYLTLAKANGLVSGKIDLRKPITRIQVSQLAAKALKLSTDGLSSTKPFTDTADVYVQALSAAGIVNGYFANGTSTFKPNNTLTRGHISAIVWRMMQYRK